MAIRRYLTLADPTTGTGVDVVVEADLEVPAASISSLLAAHAPSVGTIHVGTRPLPTEGSFGEMGLEDGAVLGIGAPVASPRITASSARPELHVVGGPMAGSVLRLGDDVELGRAGADLQLPADDMVSRRHLRIRRTGDGWEIEDVGSANGTEIEGVEVTPKEATVVGSTDLIRVGNSLLRIAPPTKPGLPLVDNPDGTVGLNRRFRTGLDDLDTSVELPQEPTIGEKPSFNTLILTLLPAVAMGVIGYATNNLFLVAFAGIGAIGGVTGTAVRRRAHTRRARVAMSQYGSELAAAKARLAALRADETKRSRAAVPDLAAVAQSARAGGRLLWAMRPGETDFLRVRVGSTTRLSTIEPAKEHRELLWMVPALLDLAAVGGAVVLGDLDRARGVARAMVLQLAVHRAPSELKLVVLGGPESERAWSWVRWLPHARWANDEQFQLIGSEQVTVAARLAELRTLIKRRQDEILKRRDARFTPSIVVVYDNVSALLPDAADVLRDGPTVGVHAIAVDAVHVPDGCNASIGFGGEGDDGRVEQAGVPDIENVILDEVSESTCEVAARCLAPLQLIGEASSAELPIELRLLDLLGMHGPDAARITNLWRERSRSTAAPIGTSKSGPMEIDLIRDGPHGVVAGMSRSGKSEFLKSLIGSLAATNHPDDLSFLFIDFKGGNDYRLAATLPHAVDLATQIDNAGFERTLRLLDAELVRRQQVAGTLNTNTIEGYWSAQSRVTTPTVKMPRLVVIADEFAEFVQRSPEQIDRLVSVARLGAAYGVHLILATQQPSGVVSPQIDANSPLRVCFRTVDTQQSTEVLGTPDAASIAERHRGRGYKRAHGAPPIEFQSARVGNVRPGTSAVEPPRVETWSWSRAGRPPVERGRAGEVADQDTDFADLADAIRAAADADGWLTNAIPWPKTLAEVITLDSIEPGGPDEVPFTVADDPERQATLPAPIELGRGHVALAGAPDSGRTTALRSIAASAASAHHVDELHLYAIDLRGSGLALLRDLPHTGGVSNADATVTGKIVERLEEELRSRRAVFEASGASSLPEHNRATTPDARLPWLLFLVNGWDVLHEEASSTAGSVMHKRVLSLLTDGGRFGLQGVIAGDRSAASGQAGRLMKRRLSLRFELDTDYDAVGIPLRAVPGAMPPGRAVTPEGRVEHVAVLADGTGPGEVAAFQALAATITAREAGVSPTHRPVRIAPLPLVVPLAGEDLTRSETLPLPVGVSSTNGQLRWIDLATEGRAFVVTGRRRAGRSSALVTMGRAALANGIRIVCVTPKRSPLSDLAGAEHVAHDAIGALDATTLAIDAPTLLLIDDIEQLDPQHQGLLQLALAPGADLGIVVAGASTPIRMQAGGFLPVLRRARSGIVLCPESVFDSGTFGEPNFGTEHLFAGPPGRGILLLSGEVDLVQVPYAG